MSRLFAFNNAQDLVVCNLPAGHYDAEQQLWVADDVSHASLYSSVTSQATLTKTFMHWGIDFVTDTVTD